MTARLVAVLLLLTALASLRPASDQSRHLLPRLAVDHPDKVQRCEILKDSRESLVLAGGEEVTTPITGPAGSSLRFGIGARGPGAPPTWRLTLECAGEAVLQEAFAVPRAWLDRDLTLPEGRRDCVLRARVDPPSRPGADVCWAHPTVVRPQRRSPLVVVVLLDTVRADHLSLLGYERRTSPALAALARDGITFTDAASDAPWTRASVATLFTGQPALTHEVLTRTAHLSATWPTLAERLRDAGFRTVAFSTNPNVLPYWGFARGFDRFVDVGAEEWTQNSDAADVFGRAQTAIDGDDGLFVYVHVNDAHAPYDPPLAAARALLGTYDPASPGRVLDSDADPAEIRGAIDRYDAEVAYLDGQLGAFVEGLRRKGRYDGALLVVVGDHGEEFKDHGGVYHGHTLFREQLHVPLVMKLPRRAGAGGTIAAPVRMLDVSRTIASLLHLDGSTFAGRALVRPDGAPALGSSMPRFAVTDMDDVTAYASEDDAYTLIRQTRPTARTWLFQRGDALQTTDLAESAPAPRAVLEHVLDAELLARRGGWHVRLCGGMSRSRIGVEIASADRLEHVERFDLEPGDTAQLEGDDRVIRLDATLAPATQSEEVFGKLVATERPDQDEILFHAEGPISVVLREPQPLLVGAAGRPHPIGAPITQADAAAPPTWTAVCGSDPSVLVWYAGIPGGQATTHDAKIDAEVERRLRALGYVH